MPTSGAGFVGVNPPAARVTNDGGIASQTDSTRKNGPGQIAFYRDSKGRWSVLKYVQSFASIVKGSVITQVHAAEATTGGVSGFTLSQDPNVVTTASVGQATNLTPAGIAAAEVSNTGYWFWSYIAGYCPDAAMPTLYASGQPLRMSATYAGRLSSAQINASFACVGATIPIRAVAIALGQTSFSTANSTNSVMICGWLNA